MLPSHGMSFTTPRVIPCQTRPILVFITDNSDPDLPQLGEIRYQYGSSLMQIFVDLVIVADLQWIHSRYLLIICPAELCLTADICANHMLPLLTYKYTTSLANL
jgi:hypothetical protein